MAESRRGTAATAVMDDEAQKKRDAMFRIFFLVGLVILVLIMVLIASFLSGQEAF